MDTPGAYPGLDAEERGQAEAIAYNLREMAGLRTPIVVTVTGEGGSGGALAIAVGDRVEHARARRLLGHLPRGLRVDPLARPFARAEEAATAMKITAPDLAGGGPRGRGHPGAAGRRAREPRGAVQGVDEVLWRQLRELGEVPPRSSRRRATGSSATWAGWDASSSRSAP